MEAVFAAQRFRRVDAMRRELLVEAEDARVGCHRGHRARDPVGARRGDADHRVRRRTDDHDRRRARAPVPGRPGVAGGRRGSRSSTPRSWSTAVDQLMPDLRDAVAAQALELAEAEPVGTFRREPADADREGASPDHRGTLGGGGAEPAGRARNRRRWDGRAAADATARSWNCTRSTAGPPRSPRPSSAATRDDADTPRPDPHRRDLRPAHRRGHRRDARRSPRHPGLRRWSPSRCWPSSTTKRRWRRISPVVEGIGPIPVSRRPGTVRRGRVLDADAHPPRDRDGPLRRPRPIPTPGRAAQTREMAGRPMYGTRLRNAGIKMPGRPQRRLGRRRRTCLENNCPFCQGHHTVKHHGNWESPPDPRQRRRRRMDLPHRPTIHRPTRTQSPRLHHRPDSRRRTRRTASERTRAALDRPTPAHALNELCA